MNPLPIAQIQRHIYFIRDCKVMLDSDLAGLYQVTTFNLNKAVQRNRESFPTDFMFQLTVEEYKSLIFQTGISKTGRGGRRYLPYAFTREGVSMLSSVLKSKRATMVNITIMRAFVRLGDFLDTHKELARKLQELERKCDVKFKVVFDAIRKLMRPIRQPKPILVRGFRKD